MTTIGQKADYVKRVGQTRDHVCHWPGCARQVPPAMWGCREHWYRLPAALRARIWRTYRPGQEINLSPSREYIAVARAVQTLIEDYESKRRPAQRTLFE
jgi:hypothetical protein